MGSVGEKIVEHVVKPAVSLVGQVIPGVSLVAGLVEGVTGLDVSPVGDEPPVTSGTGAAGLEAVPSGVGMPVMPAGAGLEASAGEAPPATGPPADWYTRKRAFPANPSWSSDPRIDAPRRFPADPPWTWAPGMK